MEEGRAQQIRGSQEFQSALIRLSIWAFMLMLLGLGKLFAGYPISWTDYLLLFGIHLVWYLGILISTLRRPQLWPARTYFSILADLSGTTLLIYMTGDPTSPFFLLYAISFLSQGMRFGPTNLLLASLGSLLAYGLVVTISDGWVAYTLEVVFVCFVLVVLPAYEFVLLRKLQKAKQIAEQASRARGDFLATMTHELRTPLSGVIGMAGLLRRTGLDSEQRDYVDSISTSADVLQALVGDILDLSKIDAGKLELNLSSFELRDALNETLWAMSSQALDKRLELVSRVAADVPDLVVGDPLRFRQILFNLVGNAIKFTDEGSVVVDLQVAEANWEVAESHLLVEIRDTGIGIPADRLGKVFDTFWQADPSSTRRFGGTGLGTAIARDLCHLMGGSIGVESREGHGSTFRFRLPILRAQQAASPIPPGALRGISVLILESDAQSGIALQEACVAAAMLAERVYDFDRWFAFDRRTRPGSWELVLIADTPAGADLQKIGDLVRSVLGTVPIVSLQYPRRQKPLPGPAATRAFKPVNAPQLWTAMAEALAAADANPDREPAPVADMQTAETAPRVLVAEDDDINAKLICSLLNKLGCMVTLAGDGRVALNKATQRPFDLAFVDLRMPHMDGLDFTRAYRAQEMAGRYMPIIALTANASDEIRDECLRIGMDEFVTKPVDPAVLQALLHRHLASMSFKL